LHQKQVVLVVVLRKTFKQVQAEQPTKDLPEVMVLALVALQLVVEVVVPELTALRPQVLTLVLLAEQA
jgi:hypothetical protein